MSFYPGSTPEFRLLKKEDGVTVFQVRYVHAVTGYTSKWQDIPVVEENASATA